MRIKLNIVDRLRWYFSDRSNPKPALFYPTDNWITDPKEIINAIRLDDELGIEPKPESED